MFNNLIVTVEDIIDTLETELALGRNNKQLDYIELCRQRSLAIVADGHVKRDLTTSDKYIVLSSTPNTSYFVSKIGGEWICTCGAYLAHCTDENPSARRCKHIDAVGLEFNIIEITNIHTPSNFLQDQAIVPTDQELQASADLFNNRVTAIREKLAVASEIAFNKTPSRSFLPMLTKVTRMVDQTISLLQSSSRAHTNRGSGEAFSTSGVTNMNHTRYKGVFDFFKKKNKNCKAKKRDEYLTFARVPSVLSVPLVESRAGDIGSGIASLAVVNTHD
jgi:hypothetical protein